MFLRYAHARVESEMQTLSYRVYISDALWAPHNGQKMAKRWAELIENKPKKTVSTAETVTDIIARAGLVVGGEKDESI